MVTKVFKRMYWNNGNPKDMFYSSTQEEKHTRQEVKKARSRNSNASNKSKRIIQLASDLPSKSCESVVTTVDSKTSMRIQNYDTDQNRRLGQPCSETNEASKDQRCDADDKPSRMGKGDDVRDGEYKMGGISKHPDFKPIPLKKRGESTKSKGIAKVLYALKPKRSQKDKITNAKSITSTSKTKKLKAQGSLKKKLENINSDYNNIIRFDVESSESESECLSDPSLKKKEIITDSSQGLVVSSVSSSGSDTNSGLDTFSTSNASSNLNERLSMPLSGSNENTDDYDDQIRKYLRLVQANKKHIQRFVNRIQADPKLRSDKARKKRFLKFLLSLKPKINAEFNPSCDESIDGSEGEGYEHPHMLFSTTGSWTAQSKEIIDDIRDSMDNATHLDLSDDFSIESLHHNFDNSGIPVNLEEKKRSAPFKKSKKRKNLLEHLLKIENARFEFLHFLLRGETEKAKRVADNALLKSLVEVLEYSTDNKVCDPLFGYEDPIYADDISTCSNFDWTKDEGKFVRESSLWFEDCTQKVGGVIDDHTVSTERKNSVREMFSHANGLVDDSVVDHAVEVISNIQRKVQKHVLKVKHHDEVKLDKNFFWNTDELGYIAQSDVWLQECTKSKATK